MCPISPSCHLRKFPPDSKKSPRVRYIYAPIASCRSDPSPSVHEGRTIWTWIENEVNGGFGERDESGLVPSQTNSANFIKEFPSRIENLHAVPSFSKDSPTTPLGRILVLLQSGEIQLCDQNLSTIVTCQVYSIAPTLTPIEPTHVRVQTYCANDIRSSSATSNTIDDSVTSLVQPDGLLVYVTRLKPLCHQVSDQPLNQSLPNNRSKKRKSAPAKLSSPAAPLSSKITHYSHLELFVVEVRCDQVNPLGGLSSSQDFLDVAIGAQGWVTIMAPNHSLSTYCLSYPPDRSSNVEPFDQLKLVAHPQCGPLQLSTRLQPHQSDTASNLPLPVIAPLPCSVPVVFLFVSHQSQPPTSSSSTCLGLVLDLYHQAVLFALEFPWPTPPRPGQSASLALGPEPLTFSLVLSSLSQPHHIYFCLSYPTARIVQVLQAPEFADDEPTWVEVLNPTVADATLTWISSGDGIHDTRTNGIDLNLSKKVVLSESLLDRHLMNHNSKALELETSSLQSVKSFISRFNQIWAESPEKYGTWNEQTVKAAELAWSTCVMAPLRSFQNGALDPKSKLESSDPQHIPVENKEVDMVDGQLSIAEASDSSSHGPTSPNSSLQAALRSTLSKPFVEALLKICLQEFATDPLKTSVDSAAHDSLNLASISSNPQTYPRKIVSRLLKSRLVEESMIHGGVVAALRRTQDLRAVRSAVSELVDVGEIELVETIRWAIRSASSSGPVENISGKATRVLSSPSATPSPSRLRFLLPNIVSQPLSKGPLRKAFKDNLSTGEILAVLHILDEWINWWLQVGMGNLETHVANRGPVAETDPITSGPKLSNLAKQDAKKTNPSTHSNHANVDGAGIPSLGCILEFVEVLLDSHFIGLIQSKESFETIKRLNQRLNRQIESDKVFLESISGCLTQFAELHHHEKRPANLNGSRKAGLKPKLPNRSKSDKSAKLRRPNKKSFGKLSAQYSVTPQSTHASKPKPSKSNRSSKSKLGQRSKTSKRVKRMDGRKSKLNPARFYSVSGDFSLEQFPLGS